MVTKILISANLRLYSFGVDKLLCLIGALSNGLRQSAPVSSSRGQVLTPPWHLNFN